MNKVRFSIPFTHEEYSQLEIIASRTGRSVTNTAGFLLKKLFEEGCEREVSRATLNNRHDVCLRIDKEFLNRLRERAANSNRAVTVQAKRIIFGFDKDTLIRVLTEGIDLRN